MSRYDMEDITLTGRRHLLEWQIEIHVKNFEVILWKIKECRSEHMQDIIRESSLKYPQFEHRRAATQYWHQKVLSQSRIFEIIRRTTL